MTVTINYPAAGGGGGGGSGGSIATDPIWTAAGQIAVATGASAASVLNIGSPLQVLQVNAGGTGYQFSTLSGGGNALTSNPLSQFAATTSLQLAGVMSDETGTGSLVFATSPTLVTPALGTPSSGTLTSCAGLPISTGVSGLAAGAATFLATPTSANLATLMTDETGTGANVFANSPTLVTPALGTPSSGVLSSCTGYAAANLTGLGTGIATFLGTPSSANLAAAITDETGSGSLVFATSPTLTTPTTAGVSTADGANITTANVVTVTTNAGTVNVAKGLNTGTNNADTTYSFSTTPGTNQWFQLYHVNTDTNPHTLTLPSAFSLVTQAARTTCVVPASGQVFLTWRYDGTAYHIYGDSAYFNNFASTTNPAVTDDVSKGYGPGSLWGNTTANTLYWCESNSSGAAVWNLVAGTGTVTNMGGNLTANSLVLGAGTNDTKVVAGVTTDGVSVVNLGVAGTSVGGVKTANATSGTITVTPPTGALGTITQTQAVANGQQGMAGAQFFPISASYTTLAADRIPGKTIRHTSATAHTVTIDGAITWGATNEASMFGISNPAGMGTITIALTGSATLAWSKAAGGTGARTLAAGGECVITWVGGTAFEIVGNDALT